MDILSHWRTLFLNLFTLFLILFLSFVSQAYSAPIILMLGDSLTAGYGIDKQKAFPALIEKALQSEGLKDLKVINGGVDGDTTAGGLARLAWLMKTKKPSHILVCLGGNDGLRGLKLEQSQKNLSEIIKRAKDQKLPVLLMGMQIPPNYGPEYTKAFRSMYPELATEHKVPIMPFLLEGVAGEAKYNLPDMIHPNEAGHEIIAKNLLPYVKALLHE
jgi:acyl-CoA thioesterase-1